jgi:DNA-binding transcriptional LysR family regulator
MDRLQAMKVFLKVVEAGGLAGAARQLHMSPPAVTRALAGLEERIGARLLIRSTRSLQLTEAGSRYAEDCRRILADLAESEASAAGLHATPTGTLSVTAPALFGRHYVLPILTEYLDLHVATNVQTLFVDRLVNLIDEGVDVAVRIGALPDSEYRAIPIGAVRLVICGAPAYFERHGRPLQPADLAAHQVVAANSVANALDWRFGADRSTKVSVRPRLVCNSNDAAIAAAVSGWGLTRVLSYQVGPLLEDGRLQTVLPEFETGPLPIHVVYPEGRRASAKVRAFVELAVERLRANRMIN